MDRFIDLTVSAVIVNNPNLKSNMDRFIGCWQRNLEHSNLNLKSNMDRFIEPLTKKTIAIPSI